MNDRLLSALGRVSEFLNADIIRYNGGIDRSGAEKIIEITHKPTCDNVLLVLCTPGGDADAAYKIARRLQEKYNLFYLYVYGYCKSAGTLIAVGADELIMSDFSEFGPLDVQLQEKDEILRYSSGLNVQEALMTLKAETQLFFQSNLIELIEAGMSTKTAAELAVKLTSGFFNPIVTQIDPFRIGETLRAVKVAMAYGERLVAKGGNLLSADALARLVQEYPDHGFVIDYEEAKGIFKNVRKHNTDEEEVGKILDIKYPARKKIVDKLFPKETESETVNTPRNTKRSGKNQEEPRSLNPTVTEKI